MKICKIIAEDLEEYEYLKKFLSKYPIVLTQSIEISDEIPTLIVGWKTVKRLYSKQNIFDKEITNKLSWAYGKSEEENESRKLIEKFINAEIKKWLPQKISIFDTIFSDYTLNEFAELELSSEEKVYIFFDNDGIYINHNEKNFVVNIKSLSITSNDYKSEITNFLNKIKPILTSYKNVSKYVNLDNLNCFYTLENLMWAQYKQELTLDYFNLIPGFKINKYIPFIMSKIVKINLNVHEKGSLKRACKRDKITEWLCSREINFKSDFKKEGLKFRYDNTSKLTKIQYSNKRTLTGRMVATDKYNPQNLPKNTDDRSQIVSRFPDGKIVTFDYTSFETRISLYLCDDEFFIEKYRKKDMHLETARLIYNRENVTIEERDNAKIINHSILYGASKETIAKRLGNVNDIDEAIGKVRNFLFPLFKKSKEVSKSFTQYGYVINNWGTIVYPDKNYATFNNLVQSTATEILIDKIGEIKKILTNYKSEFIFQVHDSLVFDIHPEENDVIKILIKKVIKHGDMDFGINYSSGFNYKDLSIPLEIMD